MAQYDELDMLICDKRMTESDFEDLYKVLAISPPSRSDRRDVVNQEIRHNYGHSVANMFRQWYEPDYFLIVKAVATYLKLPVKDHHTLEEIED